MDVSHALQPKSDQLNADDLIASPMTYIIQQVDVRESGDQPISIWLQGFSRPYKPCKSMGRVLATAWGTDSSMWAGQGITLYCDPTVTWAGKAVGGIRISHLTGLQQPMQISLTASRGKRKPFTVQPLILQQPTQ
jgi:hypothetical protein